jgi:hypothetical protein
MKARRLSVIAAYINAHCPGLHARIEHETVNTDRHIGYHLRHPGKGRRGTRLLVEDLTRMTRTGHPVVLDHHAAETYRCNDEVERWLARWEANHA